MNWAGNTNGRHLRRGVGWGVGGSGLRLTALAYTGPRLRGNGALGRLGHLGPMFPDPRLDIGGLPDLAHHQFVVRLREVRAGHKLLDTLATEAAEAYADLGGAHEVMHGRQHSYETSGHLTMGQGSARISHVTSPREIAAAAGLNLSTRRESFQGSDRDYRYFGVLRRGRQIVADCGHPHVNRTESSRSGGISAHDCIAELVKASTRPALVDHVSQQISTRWMRLGPYATNQMREQIRADAPAEIAAYQTKVAQIAALVATPLPGVTT